MGSRPRWNIVLPVALIAFALLGVAWFDITTGGDAEPPPLLAEVGTPRRGTFIPPTATPPGPKPTPQPGPTFAGQLPGTPEERDQKRRNDLLLLVYAANEMRDRDGEYPTTKGNRQTICVYKEADVGCQFADFLDEPLPEDPRGAQYGYWYASDGDSATLFASLEKAPPDDELCAMDDPDLLQHGNIICVTVP